MISVKDILAVEDPAERARLCTLALSEMHALRVEAAARRLDAIAAMRAEGASYEVVARVMGVHKSRAQQLCNQAAKR